MKNREIRFCLYYLATYCIAVAVALGNMWISFQIYGLSTAYGYPTVDVLQILSLLLVFFLSGILSRRDPLLCALKWPHPVTCAVLVLFSVIFSQIALVILVMPYTIFQVCIEDILYALTRPHRYTYHDYMLRAVGGILLPVCFILGGRVRRKKCKEVA